MAQPSMSASAAAARPPSVSSDLRLLLWLRWTLLLRTYSRSRKNQIGLAVTALVFGPISVGLATVVYLFGSDSPQMALLIARAALTLIWALWIVAPLLGFPLNESNDPSRLFVYPVPLRTILAGGVLGSLVEPTTLLAVPVCIAAAALFCKSIGAALIAFAAVLLFMLHTLAAAQFILLSLIGLLRSRKFRDVTIVLLPLFAMAAYVGQQLLARGLIGSAFGMVARLGVWSIADWLPPGWAVRACVDAARGSYAPALLPLAALLAAVLLPIPFAAAALGRLYSGERGRLPAPGSGMSAAALPQRSARLEPLGAESNSGRGGFGGGGSVAALGWKERIYLVREPQYKALAVNALYTMAVVLFGFGVGFGHNAAATEGYFRQAQGTFGGYGLSFQVAEALLIFRALLIPSLLLLAATQLTFNIFGGDGSAVTVLLTFPTPRLKILLGKNLAYAPVLLILGGIGAVASALLLHSIDLIGLELAWVIVATLVLVGIGNLVSVRFPVRMIVRGQRYKSGGGVSYGGAQGCAYAYLQSLCYLGALAMLIPPAAGFVLPPVLGDPGLLWATVPLAFVYAGIIYWIATRWAASLLTTREPDIVAALASDE